MTGSGPPSVVGPFDDPNWLYLLILPVAGIVLIIQCLCWRRTRDIEQKDSMFGVEGRHSRINNNSAADTTTGVVDETDSSRGPLARQLPDLPAADTCSDLYATVDEKKESDSETYSTNYDKINHKYAKVKGEHPYDKVKKNGANGEVEHPYAKVAKKGKGSGTELEHPYAKVKKSSQTKSQSNNGEDDDEDDDHAYARVKPTTSTTNPNTPVDSNQPSTSRQAALQQAQQVPNVSNTAAPVPPTRTRRSLQSNEPVHFSGDSQDSRGYTSISVREPMSHIATGGSVFPQRAPSDDSESLYAAIEESNYQMINEFPRREANSPLPPVPVPVPAPVLPLPPVPVTASTSANTSSSSRRWSKADINYSEFDVVREASVVMEIDDDNYNVIQDSADADMDPHYQEIAQSSGGAGRHGYEKLRTTHGYEVIQKTGGQRSNSTNVEDLYSRPKKKNKAPEVNDLGGPNDIYSKPLKKSERKVAEAASGDTHDPPDQLYSKPLRKSERSSEVKQPDVTDHHPPDELYSKPLKKSERSSEVIDPSTDVYSKPLKKSDRQPELNELYSIPVKKSQRSSEVSDHSNTTKVDEPDYLYSKLMKRPDDERGDDMYSKPMKKSERQSEVSDDMYSKPTKKSERQSEVSDDMLPPKLEHSHLTDSKRKKKIEIINVIPTPDELYSKVKRVKRRSTSSEQTPSPGPSSLENQTPPCVSDSNGLTQPPPGKDTTIEYF